MMFKIMFYLQIILNVGGAMHFIYYINRSTSTKVNSTIWAAYNQQYTAYMSVAGLERMTTGSAVSALSYLATQVDIEIHCTVIESKTVKQSNMFSFSNRIRIQIILFWIKKYENNFSDSTLIL